MNAKRDFAAAEKRPLAVVVLAAGQGTRMKSEHAKVLHLLAGKTLIRHVLETAAPLEADRTVVVVGHQAQAVENACEGFDVEFALQAAQRGTGHAVAIAGYAGLATFSGDVLILYGDVPLLTTASLERLIVKHRTSGATLTLLTTVADDPSGYGRIVRDAAGVVARIVEDRDANPEEKAIHETNPGIYCVRGEFLFPALERLRPDNAQGELYLTDIVGAATRAGERVESEPVAPSEVAGINSRADLAALEALVREKIVRTHMLNGVSFVDPKSAYVDAEVEIGPDTVIGPMVHLSGRTSIGRDCQIDGHAFLTDAVIADRVHLRPMVVITSSRIDAGAIVGPFAQLRPGAHLGEDVHIGNFVEVKQSTLGRGTKANHLAYLGDATIGEETNIGAGTITCNYDGFTKSRTTIGNRVQIGSDSTLVAPVEIGDDAYVATATTVRHDVEPGALAFNPKPDQRRPGWVEGFRKRKQGTQKKR